MWPSITNDHERNRKKEVSQVLRSLHWLRTSNGTIVVLISNQILLREQRRHILTNQKARSLTCGGVFFRRAMEEGGHESDVGFGRRLSYLPLKVVVSTSDDGTLSSSCTGHEVVTWWPCLMFQNPKQLRQSLQQRRRYDFQEVLVEIMTHVQNGGRSADSVAYLLGKQLPTRDRLVFCPQNMLDSNTMTYPESNPPPVDPLPMLLGALHEARQIQWRARVADENNRHPMPGPEDHAPCA